MTLHSLDATTKNEQCRAFWKNEGKGKWRPGASPRLVQKLLIRVACGLGLM